jgi:two-component system, OmpR family, sensor kinase
MTGRLLSRRAIAPVGVAMERQSRFVAEASHELRTPLTQLHTRAQLLQHRLSRDSAVMLSQEELDGILASTRQFGEVIEDVLRSVQARDDPGLRAPVDLPAILTGVAEAEAARASAAGVSLSVACDPAARDLAVPGAGPALRRVVAALVDNALTHTQGGGHIQIGFIAASSGREVEVCVRDDGAGFPPEDAGRIFDRHVPAAMRAAARLAAPAWPDAGPQTSGRIRGTLRPKAHGLAADQRRTAPDDLRPVRPAGAHRVHRPGPDL